MNRHRIVSWTLVVLVFPLALSGRAYAQEMPGMGHEMMTEEQKEEMAARHEQMMAEMEAASARLDSRVAVMNAAEGNAKVDAIGAVVAELVAQHRAMHEGMMKMHGHMTGTRMHGEERGEEEHREHAPPPRR